MPDTTKLNEVRREELRELAKTALVAKQRFEAYSMLNANADLTLDERIDCDLNYQLALTAYNNADRAYKDALRRYAQSIEPAAQTAAAE